MFKRWNLSLFLFFDVGCRSSPCYSLLVWTNSAAMAMDPDAADAVLEPMKWEVALSPFDVPPPKDRLHAYKWQLATDKQAKKLEVLWRKAVPAASLSADQSASDRALNLNFFLSVGHGRYSTMSYKIYSAQLLGSFSIF